MTTGDLDFNEASILRRLDRASPDSLLKSLIKELARLGHAHNQLRARLAAMESLQAMADRIAAGETAESFDAYPSRAWITAENFNSDAHGFHSLEHDAAGTPFRWTGPDRQFSFQIFIERRMPAHFELRFDKLFANTPVEELLCYVDGDPAKLAVTGKPGGFVAKGVMSPRKNSGGSVLTFLCPKMETPESRAGTDKRPLGVQFRSLAIETEAVSLQRSGPAPLPPERLDPKPLSLVSPPVAPAAGVDDQGAAEPAENLAARNLPGIFPTSQGAPVVHAEPKPGDGEANNRAVSAKPAQ